MQAINAGFQVFECTLIPRKHRNCHSSKLFPQILSIDTGSESGNEWDWGNLFCLRCAELQLTWVVYVHQDHKISNMLGTN